MNIKVVVSNFNARADTEECIRSLMAAGLSAEQIIVVDSASSDGSVEPFRQLFPAIELIELPDNPGYTGGINAGLHSAMAQGAEWMLIMNNDTSIAPDFLIELQRASLARPDLRILGPLILFHDHPELIWNVTTHLIPHTLISLNPYRRQPLNRFTFPAVLDVDFANGCAMLIRRDVIRSIGYLDSSFFVYSEDVDFCFRARRQGFKIGIATRARMTHKVSRTMAKQKEKTRWLRMRNQIWVYRRHARGLQRPLMFFFSMLKMAKYLFEDVRRGQFNLFATTFKAWWIGWAGSLPPFTDYDRTPPTEESPKPNPACNGIAQKT